MQATRAGRVTAWALLALALAANWAGYALDLYARFPWFDRVLHAGTILALTLWMAVLVFGRALKGEPRHRVLTVILLTSLGIAAGALWEVAEWAFDRVAPGDVIKGKHDTILDIVMDTAGALSAALLARALLRHPR